MILPRSVVNLFPRAQLEWAETKVEAESFKTRFFSNYSETQRKTSRELSTRKSRAVLVYCSITR